MSFREFTANIVSTRDFEGTSLKDLIIADITTYLNEINVREGKEKGFSLVMLAKGGEVYKELSGTGGYSGVMIKSPHYIGLTVSKDNPEAEFFAAYHMQSVVRKLYDMMLGSCWINIRSVPEDLKTKLTAENGADMQYLLAFGLTDEKAIKHKQPHMTVTNTQSGFIQNPYGTKVSEAAASDRARNSLGEMVYLYEWGRQATYEELENRGMADIFLHVRNAPSYKNLQPCRIILKDGEAELAVVQPKAEGSYIDAGIMMYTLHGLAKDLGIPGKWRFAADESENKEYEVIAKIEL